ncbi:MAG: hypothetical protein RXR51_04030 [Nitrososphaeria archaeon]
MEAETLPGTPGRGLDFICRELIERASSQDFLRGVLIPYFGFTPSFMEFLKKSQVENLFMEHMHDVLLVQGSCQRSARFNFKSRFEHVL